MNIPLNHAARRFFLSIAALICMVFLAACGGPGNSNSATAPTPKAPTPIPTVALQTYTGQGFTLRYPADWKATGSAPVVIGDAVGLYNMSIGPTANPNGVVSADKAADGGLTGTKANLQNPQSVKVPATVTLNGLTWSQRAVIGNSTENGQTVSIELVILVTNHPAHAATTKSYILVYGAEKSLFDQASQMYFMPMLLSFKFTA